MPPSKRCRLCNQNHPRGAECPDAEAPQNIEERLPYMMAKIRAENEARDLAREQQLKNKPHNAMPPSGIRECRRPQEWE